MQDLAVGTSFWPGFYCYSQGLFWHKRAIRPKPEAGSLPQPHFNLLFCSGRVFRGYSQRLQEQMRGGFGGAIPGLLGESLLKGFFFVFQAALLSSLVAINTWNRYAGLERTSDQLVLASDFTSCTTSSTLWWILSSQWNGETVLPKRAAVISACDKTLEELWQQQKRKSRWFYRVSTKHQTDTRGNCSFTCFKLTVSVCFSLFPKKFKPSSFPLSWL